MSNHHYEWARAEERALARYVRPSDLSAALRWPTYISRLDLLTAEGPRGVAAQLYELMRKQKWQYDLAPFNPRSGVTQLIRTPATLYEEKRGTCLDLAVLFATLCLANDLLPIIVCLEGHALAGFSLRRTRQDNQKPPKALAWEKGKLINIDVLKDLLTQEYLLVECTGAAQSQSLAATFPEGRGRESAGMMSFERAVEAGREQLMAQARLAGEVAQANQREFLYALDIHDLQVNHGFAPTQSAAPASSSSAIFNQRGQTVHGSQTNINGDINAPILSGQFKGPVNVGDIKVGNVNGVGIAIGHGARVSVNQQTGLAADEAARLFTLLTQKVNALPESATKEDAQEAVKKLKTEAQKADQADEGRVYRTLEFLVEILPDAWEVTVNTILNPLAGLNTVFKKIAERVKAEKEKKDAAL